MSQRQGPGHTCESKLGSRVGVKARAGWGIRALNETPAAWVCFCRDTNVRFSTELRRLQSLPKCERLPLPSFLLLPFQRITRLRMLLQVLSWPGAFSAPPTPLETLIGPLAQPSPSPSHHEHRTPLNQTSQSGPTKPCLELPKCLKEQPECRKRAPG